jgi:hypothetical protein
MILFSKHNSKSFEGLVRPKALAARPKSAESLVSFYPSAPVGKEWLCRANTTAVNSGPEVKGDVYSPITPICVS